MAEVFGVVASSAGVVSLAFQLAGYLKKLNDFYDLMNDAPEDIRCDLEEIEISSLLLGDIDQDLQQQIFVSPKIKEAATRSLQKYKAAIDALGSLVQDLDCSMSKNKKRGSFKVALKKSKVDQIRSRLERAKSSVLLANQLYLIATQRQDSSIWRENFAEINVALLQLVQNTTNTAMLEGTEAGELAIGTRETGDSHKDIIIQGKVGAERNNSSCRTGRKVLSTRHTFLAQFLNVTTITEDRSSNTSFSLKLPYWLCARKFVVALKSSYRGWDQSFRVYKVSPWHSLVFQYSATGDVVSLQRLFQEGIASPFEIDSKYGWTPLHVAAYFGNPEACSFLMANGADANARTDNSGGKTSSYLRALFPYRNWIREVAIYSHHYYETPLHLIAKGRRTNQTECFTQLLPESYKFFDPKLVPGRMSATLEVLLKEGCSDPLFTDADGLSVLESWMGSPKDFKTLYSQEYDNAISSVEIINMLLLQLAFPQEFIDIIRVILPEGKVTNVVTRNISGGYGEHPSLLVWMYPSILAKLVAKWALDFEEMDSWHRSAWAGLLKEFVRAGSDIHVAMPAVNELGEKHSLLLVVLSRSKGFPELAFGAAVYEWLRILDSVDINLEEYGKTETSLKDQGQYTWDFRQQVERGFLPMRMTTLHIGRRPIDFRFEFDQMHTALEMFGNFWANVEEEYEDTIQEIYKPEEQTLMPGAWLD